MRTYHETSHIVTSFPALPHQIRWSVSAHPNVTFHFTPTSASWLNQIEIWFGILGRKALNGASFNSTQELTRAIDDFCEVWHEHAHPFVWRKREVRGSQLKNTIANLLE